MDSKSEETEKDEFFTENSKIDFNKRQFKLKCVQQLKCFKAQPNGFNGTIFDYLKTFEREPAKTMYGQFRAIIKWIKSRFDQYCQEYRFTIEYNERNVIHVHGLYTCENRMKRRWFLEKSKLFGFVFSKPVVNYDRAWNYLIKDIDEMKEIVDDQRGSDFSFCLHLFIFNNDISNGIINQML